jgi:hypothetical protein
MAELIALGMVTMEGVHDEWNGRSPSETMSLEKGEVYRPNGRQSALET